MDIEEAIERCATKLIEYQKQVDKLTTAMSGELRRLKKHILDKSRPQIVYIERDRTTKTENYRKQHKFKYRTIDSFGVENFFMTKRELLNSLDITNYELKQHLEGKYTVLDDLQIIVEKLM